MPTTPDPQTIVAVTGEDDRFAAILSRAAALAGDAGATVILYDIDAAGMFASPVPTAWSGDGEAELLDDEGTHEPEATHDRLDPAALDTAGRAAIATQVRALQAMGVDAWGWLPTKPDTSALADYATRQGATLVLVPEDLAPAEDGGHPRFETVG